MFVREKRINGYTYLYLVETVREDGRAKQRIIKNLGRKEAVTASGALERLASSVARYAERAVVLSQIEAGNPAGLACKRIGAPLLFGRLWEETGCRAVIEDLLAERGFEFPVERAIFATVLHRIDANDRVAIVTYAGRAGTMLEPTAVTEKAKILGALERLDAGGSTAGAEGIRQAYALAEQNFDPHGVNRVILATDGDFNIGITDDEQAEGLYQAPARERHLPLRARLRHGQLQRLP